MNKKLILALMLASGMAFAQTGSSGSTPDPQQPSTTSPSTSPATTDQTSQSATATSATDQQASMKGCLKQSGGNWILAADNGQSVNLQGDSSILKPHDGHQVQILGSRASDGSLQVSSVNMISDSCTTNQASIAGAAAGASAADAATTNTQAASASIPAATAAPVDQSASSTSAASTTTPTTDAN